MSSMPAERARTRLESLAAAGLDAVTFGTAATEVLQTAVPFAAFCLAPVDPATQLITGTVKGGGLGNEQDAEWAYWEYEADEAWDFRTTARRPGGVTSTFLETDGHLERSRRHVEFYRSVWDFGDELRAALQLDGVMWGAVALFRENGTHFTPAEHQYLSAVAPVIARGLRTALIAGAAALTDGPGDHPGGIDAGPAVLVIGPDDAVKQASVGAPARVVELGGGPLSEPLPMPLLSLVASARSYAAGRHTDVPRVRIRSRSAPPGGAGSGWLLAHASPLLSPAGTGTDVVITIEPARAPEIVPLEVAADGWTEREQAVVRLVLRGIGTSEIAAALHLSAYTVQDHLKAIFAKTGVRSRRELTAQVFYDHYAPRLGDTPAVGPSGWFSEMGPAAG